MTASSDGTRAKACHSSPLCQPEAECTILNFTKTCAIWTRVLTLNGSLKPSPSPVGNDRPPSTAATFTSSNGGPPTRANRDDPGHRSGGYTLEQRAAEAVGVAEACGMYTDDARPALVCHRYGGTVGLASAELYPDRFAALIACDMSMSRPGNRSESSQERVRNRPAPRPHSIHPTREAILARFRLAPDQPCANTYLFDYLANHSIREADGGYCWKFDPGIFAMDGQRDTTWWDSVAGRFAGLSLPRGLIYAMNSELVNAEATDYVCALTEDFIPVRGIADAWHHLMLD